MVFGFYFVPHISLKITVGALLGFQFKLRLLIRQKINKLTTCLIFR